MFTSSIYDVSSLFHNLSWFGAGMLLSDVQHLNENSEPKFLKTAFNIAVCV